MSLPRGSHHLYPGYHDANERSQYLAPQQDSRRASSLHAENTRYPAEHRRAASAGHGPKSRWPPIPTVEDEISSLAREKSPPPARHPADDAQSRGSVDQVPIMDDAKGTAHSSKKRAQSSTSAAGSGPATPASVESSEERRFVLVSDAKKPHRKDDHAQQNESLRPQRQDPRAHSKRSASQLRINPNASGQVSSREVSPNTLASGSEAKPHSGDYVVSPAPMSSAQGQYFGSLADAFSPKKPGSGPRYTDRYQGRSSLNSDPERSSSFPRHVSSSSAEIGSLGASLRDMQRNMPPTSYAPSDVSSRSDARGRDRKPRSCVSSSSSSGSESPDNSPKTQPAKRNSQYSFSGSAIPQENEFSPRGVARASSTHAGPINTPQRPQPSQHAAKLSMPNPADYMPMSSSMPNRSYFPADQRASARSPGVSPRVSPMHSPYNTPPPSPGYETDGYLHGSPRGHTRQNSRPVTPSPLSPSQSNGYEAQDHSHLYPPQPGNPPRLPPRPNSPPNASSKIQPQMVETNRPSTLPYAPRSRQSSPLPTTPGQANPLAFKTNSAPATQPPAQGAANTGRQSETSQATGQFSPPPPPLPERPKLSALDPHLPGQSGPRRSFEKTPRPSDPSHPSQAFIRSRSAMPHELPRLPPCPRPTLIRGYNDWSTLPGHTDFDICPTCRKGLEDAGIEAHFVPSPQHSQQFETRCDMSIPWVRMAWLLLLQRRPTHPTVIHEVASILNHKEPCPGREIASRKWYRLYDAEHGRYLSDFDVCPQCTQLLEALFPNLQGVLDPPSSKTDKTRRNCDLRSDGSRFPRYVDLLDTVSHQAYEYRREPNLQPFVQLAKKLTSVAECRRDDQLVGQPWHFMPHLPDLTVCEDCYRDVVSPQIKAGSSLANQLHRSVRFPPQHPRPLSCQLYSARMRELWAKACSREDFEILRQAVTQRVAKERDLQRRHAQIGQLPEQERIKEGKALVAEWRRWA